jgi:spore coat polysaccharide biosynthesis predicted glycosyltransferase SpsG
MTWAKGLVLACRADATPTIGAGHAMRLSVLAAAWQAAGGEVAWQGEITIPFVERRLAELGIPLQDELEEDRGVSVFVIDSYDATVRYTKGFTNAVVRVLVDDLGGVVPPGYDVVWNPNAYGRAELYPGFSGAVLSGPEAVAIRDGLPPWRTRPDGETVVTIGGGDPSASLRDALTQLSELVAGQRFAIAGGWAPPGWRVIAPDQLWATARDAKLVVTAAGTTVWEAASVQVPVILLQTADNQRFVYRWGRDAGVPGLNTLLVDAEFLAHQLRALLPAARPLPPLANGAPAVAMRLGGLARDGVTQ